MVMGWRDSEEINLNSKQFTNSWLSGERVGILYILYRWFLSVFFIVSIIQSVVASTIYFLDKSEPENVYKYFIYLTNNGRWLACLAYSVEAGLVTGRFYQEKKGIYKECIDEGEYTLPFYIKISWFLNNCTSSISVLICTVYWTLLYNAERQRLDFENFSGHLLTAIVSFIDICVSDRPWILLHSLQPVLFCIIYCFFSLIYFMTGGTNYYGVCLYPVNVKKGRFMLGRKSNVLFQKMFITLEITKFMIKNRKSATLLIYL
ncbi:protein rolling stone isoform X2 [Eurytemora carolleeae]|uniref:protein rolling stone isoform X2 n=1 Tax=Eurytemora carolleeae TaxID=1294199 RepID=UPI000C770EE3|nr:protein rolling stone isoform X2 [Eurytemora carolleeae]|eukprot:XP_023339132.1 protein rolling stone-like isoform X2 [Eurytemora affinis]